MHLTALQILKKRISFFITARQKIKRSSELKIVFDSKALIDKNFGNACEYVTVKEINALFRGKCFGT